MNGPHAPRPTSPHCITRVRGSFPAPRPSIDPPLSHSPHSPQAHGASVISEDQDFFRYVGRTYEVFQSFRVDKKGLLRLDAHPGPNPDRKPPEPRQLMLDPLPKTSNTNHTMGKRTKRGRRES